MSKSRLMSLYVEHLLQGDRRACRKLVWSAVEKGAAPQDMYFDLLWPAMRQVESLYREDRIDIAAEHMATRINRAIADQLQRVLPISESNGQRILITCAEGESQELGAQMTADLFEARGWHVHFLGGGVPNDEILSLIGRIRPHILLIYGMTPQGVPGVRALIDMIRDVGVNPSMNILVTGGVFNRAEDLWQEINADLSAADAQQAISIAESAAPRPPEVRLPGAPKERRRRRKPPLLAAAAR